MRALRTLLTLGLLLPAAAWSEAMTESPKPPVAAMKPHAVKSPNGNREDEYYWLRDDTRKDPEVLAYLAAENAYKDAMLAHVKPLEERLYGEIVGRIKQDDSTRAVPRARLLVLLALRDRQRVPDATRARRASLGRAGAGAARRERAGRAATTSTRSASSR